MYKLLGDTEYLAGCTTAKVEESSGWKDQTFAKFEIGTRFLALFTACTT
jgi:hypothetical protein